MVSDSATPCINRVNSAFEDYGEVGLNIVSISHSSVVVAQELLVAVSAICCVEGYLIVTVLQILESLVDVECLVLVNELSSVDLVVGRACASAVDDTVPAFCFEVALLVRFVGIASLLEGRVHDEAGDVHAFAITDCYGCNLH